MVRYLLKYNNDPKFEKIWLKPQFEYYNAYTEFTKEGGVYHIAEVQQFLRDCVQYVFNVKKFTWKYTKTIRDKHNHQLDTCYRIISKTPPFEGNDDMRIRMFPSLEELDVVLAKLIPKKVDPNDTEQIRFINMVKQLRNSIKKLTIQKAYALCQAQLKDKCPPPKTKRLSSIFGSCHLDNKIHRYTDITFRPFVGGGHDPTGPKTLNTWGGFYLEAYTPSSCIDVKGTLLWEYFRDVWGHGSDKNPQVTYLLHLFAFFVQFPDTRSERLILLISEIEGTGKSFCYLVMQMLFKGYCRFHDSLDPFNYADNSSKCIFIDDIFGAPEKQTRKLFPKSTCRTQRYEKKGETPIELEEFSEIFLTSNQDCALHIKPGNRRQLILKASDLKVQNRIFFRKCAAEMRDLDIAYAWYQFFKQRSIEGFNPSTDDPKNTTKGETMASCMKKSHLFMTQCFTEDDWYTCYKPRDTCVADWVKKLEFLNKDCENPTFRISRKRLYTLYKAYMKEFFSSSKVRNEDTFWKELKPLGIELWTNRLKINGSSNWGTEISFMRFRDRMKALYPGYCFAPWAHFSDFDNFLQGFEDYKKENPTFV